MKISPVLFERLAGIRKQHPECFIGIRGCQFVYVLPESKGDMNARTFRVDSLSELRAALTGNVALRKAA